ncbi:MAG: STAS domain-containing protein [Ignavibacteriales bacterium]|nr:STAS domain-containing protein [Ignavibacteriales bacterium]
MTIKSRTIHEGRVAIIDVRGALIGDQDTDNFRNEVIDFIEQGNKSLIINMQRVNYMNSSGIGAIISAHTSYKKNGGEVKLAGLTENVENLLAITRLVEVFDVHESLDGAIESFFKNKS